MPDSISNMLTTLKEDPAIKLRPNLYQVLCDIEKYFDNDFAKVYLLGYFFKHKFDSDNLTPQNKKLLISEIRQGNFEDYFYLKEKPETIKSTGWLFITFVFMILGLVMIAIGIYELKRGHYSFLVNSKSETSVFREGGYYLIFGTISLIGGFFQYRLQNGKNKFIESFML